MTRRAGRPAASVPSRPSIALLGSFEVRFASGDAVAVPTKKAQALLAYLAVQPGLAHPRDKLATLLWGDTADAQARNSLRQALFLLRRALLETDTGALVVRHDAVALHQDAAEVDVVAFERLAAQGTLDALEQAVQLYRGDFLDGFHLSEAPFEEWLRGERQRLREVAIGALERLLGHQTSAEASEAAIQTAIRLLALDPLQEAVHRALMRLYSRQGRRGMALQQYEVCVGLLQRELGVEPEPQSQQLYEDILRQRRSFGPPPRSARRIGSAGARRPCLELPVHDAPLIGRQQEIVEVTRVLHDAWQGRGVTVAILGEAGIGKTRLVEEIAAEAGRRHGMVLLGRCYESERILPFHAWVNALRGGLDVADIEALPAFDPIWRSELARLLPELGIPRRDSSTPEDSLSLFQAVAELTAALAVSKPLLWCLEDLHWADELTLRLLGFLSHRVHAWPVLILCTARDEDLDAQPGLASALGELTRAGSVQLVLAPLTRSDTGALVRHLMPPDTGETALSRAEAHVWRVSEGNPFVVMESIQAVRDDQRLERAGTAALARDSLSQRVRALIAGRFHHLSALGQDLVAAAAVIGREFEFPLLQRVARRDEWEVARGVDELVRRRVLKGVGECFDFTHDRLRTVAYADLLPLRRTLLHAAVATALEQMHGENLEPYYGVLAVHCRAANRAEEAVRYARLAGDIAARAFERGALAEAVASLEPALQALAPLPDDRAYLEHAIDLRLELRKSLFPLGELRRVSELLREARSIAERIGDALRSRSTDARLAHIAWASGRYDEGIALATDTIARATAAGDTAARLLASYYLSQCLHAKGEHRLASTTLQALQPALREHLHERFGYSFPLSIGFDTWSAWSLAELGEFESALAAGQEGIRIAEDAGQLYALFHGYFGLGVVEFERGSLGAAEAAFGRAKELTDAGGFRFMRSFTVPYLASVWAATGRVRDALALVEPGIAFSGSKGIGLAESLGLWQLGEIQLAAGEREPAEQLALRALEGARRRGERGIEARVLRLLGAIQATRSPARALEHYTAGRELATRIGMQPLVAHCVAGIGELSAQTRTPREAREHLAFAASMYRRMGMRSSLAKAEAALETLA